MRELVEKKREEVETPEQKRAVDDILNMMNETAVAHIAADRFDTCGRLQMKNAGTTEQGLYKLDRGMCFEE